MRAFRNISLGLRWVTGLLVFAVSMSGVVINLFASTESFADQTFVALWPMAHCVKWAVIGALIFPSDHINT